MVSLCQLGMYLISEKLKLKYGKTITVLIILIGHLFVFPQFFFLNQMKVELIVECHF